MLQLLAFIATTAVAAGLLACLLILVCEIDKESGERYPVDRSNVSEGTWPLREKIKKLLEGPVL